MYPRQSSCLSLLQAEITPHPDNVSFKTDALGNTEGSGGWPSSPCGWGLRLYRRQSSRSDPDTPPWFNYAQSFPLKTKSSRLKIVYIKYIAQAHHESWIELDFLSGGRGTSHSKPLTPCILWAWVPLTTVYILIAWMWVSREPHIRC